MLALLLPTEYSLVCYMLANHLSCADCLSQSRVSLPLYFWCFVSLPPCSVVSCLLTINSRWGPTPWLLGAEVFPLRARAKGMALSTGTNWAANFLIAFITPPLFSTLHGGYYFLLLGACIISGAFVWFVYPETAGKSLEELGIVFGDSISLPAEVEPKCDASEVNHDAVNLLRNNTGHLETFSEVLSTSSEVTLLPRSDIVEKKNGKVDGGGSVLSNDGFTS